VFRLSYPTQGSKTYHLCWDSGPTRRRKAGRPKMKLTAERKLKHVDMSLDNGRLWVGLKASSATSPEKHQFENYGRGTVSELRLDGKVIANMRGSWGFFPVQHPFGTGPGAFKWSALKAVVRGPVRTVIETVRESFELKGKKDKPTLIGRVIAEWAVYEGCPVLDASITCTYRTHVDAQSLSFGFPMHVGGKIQGHESLWVPLLGRAYRVGVPKGFADLWYPTLYTTPVPEEGWFAWVDAKDKHGLAVFYEKMATVRARARWVSHRPPHNPTVRIRLTPQQLPENTVTWRHRRLAGTDRMRYDLRLVGLTEDAGPAIRAAYRGWALPVEEAVEVGFPETRP
jgi:hypothetical protein